MLFAVCATYCRTLMLSNHNLSQPAVLTEVMNLLTAFQLAG